MTKLLSPAGLWRWPSRAGALPTAFLIAMTAGQSFPATASQALPGPATDGDTRPSGYSPAPATEADDKPSLTAKPPGILEFREDFRFPLPASLPPLSTGKTPELSAVLAAKPDPGCEVAAQAQAETLGALTPPRDLVGDGVPLIAAVTTRSFPDLWQGWTGPAPDRDLQILWERVQARQQSAFTCPQVLAMVPAGVMVLHRATDSLEAAFKTGETRILLQISKPVVNARGTKALYLIEYQWNKLGGGESMAMAEKIGGKWVQTSVRRLRSS